MTPLIRMNHFQEAGVAGLAGFGDFGDCSVSGMRALYRTSQPVL